MKLATCIESIDEYQIGSFVEFETASFDSNVILIVNEIKNYDRKNLKNGDIFRTEKGTALGKILFDKHFKVMED